MTLGSRNLSRHEAHRSQGEGSGNGARERGFAFVMALLAALLVAGIATTLTVVSATESQVSRNYRVNKQTTYLAEAGIQHALWQLSQDPTDTTSQVAQALGAGTYDAIINDQGNRLYEIQARGRVSSARGTGVSVQASVFPPALNYAAVNVQTEGVSRDIRGATGGAEVPNLAVDYAALLAAADWVLSGNQSFDDLYYDGNIYVRGNITLRGNWAWVEGTIVAEGNIEVEPNWQAYFISDPGMPALVAQNDINLGKKDKYASILISGLVCAGNNVKAKRYNDLWALGSFCPVGTFTIERNCGTVTIIWDPRLRLEQPLGISQGSKGYAWAPVPGTWQVLTNLAAFDSL